MSAPRALLLAVAVLASTASAGPVVKVFVAPDDGSRVASYWFRTERGSVVIDTPYLLDHGALLRARLEEDGAFPAGAVVLLSGRPEHSWGAAPLLSGGTRIWALKAHAAALANGFVGFRDAALRSGLASDRLPAGPPEVTNTFRSSLNLGFEGFTLRLFEVEVGSVSRTVAMIPETGETFTGELVSVRSHLLMDELGATAWRGALERLKGFRPKRVYPGRGEPAAAAALDEMLAYLAFLEATVREAARVPRRSLPPRDVAALKRKVVARFPGYALPALLDRSIPAEYARQRRALAEAME